MKPLDRVRQQVAAMERLYLAERSRRDLIRNALAVPVAALGFATFGYGVLWQMVQSVAFDTLHVTVTIVIVLLPTLALVFFILAARTLHGFKFGRGGLDPLILDFNDTASDIESTLIEESEYVGVRLKAFEPVARELAARTALEELGRRYREALRKVTDSNRDNLTVLESAFKQLLLAFAFLLTSVAVTLGARMYPLLFGPG